MDEPEDSDAADRLRPPASEPEHASGPQEPGHDSEPGFQAPPPSPDAHSLAVVETLRRGLAASFRAFPRALPIILPVIAISQAALVLGAPALALDPYRVPGSAAATPGTSDWLVFAGTLLFQLSIGGWAQCALLVTLEASLEGEPVPDFGHAYARALERVPAYVGTGLVVGLAVAAGGLLCFVPGLWAVALLSWAVPRAVVRGEGVRTALRHSYLLGRGRVWRILGAFVLLGLVIAPLAMTSSLTLIALSMSGHPPVDAISSLPFIVVPVVILSPMSLLVPGMQLALHARLEELGPRA